MAMSRKGAFEALNRFTKNRPTSDELWSMVCDLAFRTGVALSYDDRAVVIVSVSVLELGLEHAIKTKFVALDSSEASQLFSHTADGPLSSFSAKIQLGYALDVYGEETKGDLEIIQKVRNAFAHSFAHVDFLQPEITTLCDLLNHPKRDMFEPLLRQPSTPREKFTFTVLPYYAYFRAVAEREDFVGESRLRLFV